MSIPQQRIFLSHSSKDHDFCVRLVDDLRRILGDDDAVWYDAHGGLHGGDAWWHKIEHELNTRTTFIVVLSPDAVNSAWVNDEIDIAWRRKNHADPISRMRFIPLLLRPCAIRPSLESLQIVSFQLPRAYETALQDLLTALTLPSQSADSQKPSPVLQNHLTRQRKGKRKNTKLARQNFVKTLAGGPPIVWFHAFTLLTGLGVLAELLNRLTRILPWTTASLTLPGVGLLAIPSAIGIVVLVAPLLYFLGYRRALSPFTMLCLAIISALAIYSLTDFLSSLNFAQHTTSSLWFNQTRMLWLGGQVVFGLIMGGIFGVIYGVATLLESSDDWGEVVGLLGGILVYVLIGWLILAALSFFFRWGFGFGYAWYISIVSAVVSYLVVASLFFSVSVWRRASATSSASASWQLDISMPKECQQSSATALRILTTRPEAFDLLFTLDDHQERIGSVALSADGLILASCSDTKDIRIWDTQVGQLVRHLTDEYRTSCIAMSANGYFLASGSTSDQFIKLWNTQTNQILRTFKRDGWSSDLALALSRNERLLAVDSRNHSIDLWNIQTGQFLHMTTGHKYSVEHMALSADGAILASGCAVEKTIKLWDTQSGELMSTLNRLEYSPECLALSADGSLLASSCRYARTIELWNTHTNQRLHTLEGHEGYVTSVALSADGLILASGSEDRTIKLWNTQTGWLLCTLTDHTKAVTTVGLSANGQILASGSEDTTIKLWGVKE